MGGSTLQMQMLRNNDITNTESNEAHISPIQDARNSDMALFAEFAVRCVLYCSYPLSSAEGGDVLEAPGWA
jgi:hypothetical protein